MGKRQRLLVSLACALLAMVACGLYVGGVREEVERDRAETLRRYGGDVVELVIANRTIEAGEVVSAADVTMSDWVASLVPKGAFLDAEEAVGREVGIPVGEGVPLTELNFRDATELADIPAGHVAVSVPLTEKLGVSVGIAPGSHVMAYRVTDGAAEVIAKEAKVLAAPASGGSLSGRGTLTLAVPSQDVAAVLATSASGDLRLVIPAEDGHAKKGD